jgi:hypothetical protein
MEELLEVRSVLDSCKGCIRRAAGAVGQTRQASSESWVRARQQKLVAVCGSQMWLGVNARSCGHGEL